MLTGIAFAVCRAVSSLRDCEVRSWRPRRPVPPLDIGLLGPAPSPPFVGVVSDAETTARVPNGLALGLLIVPVANVLTRLTYLAANRPIGEVLRMR